MLVPAVLLALLTGAGACSDGEEKASGSGGAPCVLDAGPDADPCDADGDGFRAVSCGGDDCDDTRKAIHPGATDVCDGDDNDCDGTADQDDACDCAQAPPKPGLAFSDRVCLKGGWFWMGMGPTDPHAAANYYVAVPVHQVFVSPIHMDRYEVTNRRYIACLDAGACSLENLAGTSKTWDRAEHETQEQLDRPFLGGSAKNGGEYCKWTGGRLPTEAEWERAAAGLGDKPRPYPSGFSIPTCEEEVLFECGVPLTPGGEYKGADRVGTKKPNPDGLFDLGGNASEWVADLWFDDAYATCTPPCKNPCAGCSTGKNMWDDDGHGDRGGQAGLVTVTSTPHFFRSQFRDRTGQDHASHDLFNQGFRCAYPVVPKR
ncbi:MAG: SUMF1/EgtB/PvdO family nonheme iron enzyme [Polyangiaceae bacterium]